ncbi:MAG TPA: NAD(P)/FAD-dependent oxidoreductase [Anaerolineales bacterium]|nr:NAD(P)/FAD-dependent oxidoreductase [Anaerolineales bacterium]
MNAKEAEELITKKNGNLVIVGSGPIGMVSALMFKKHFENIILLERQSKEGFLQTHGFTFPIVFTPASIKILKGIGVWDKISAERSEFFGVVIHKRILGREFKFTSSEADVYSHWRNHTITKLYERVIEEGIPVQFNARVESIDFQNNVCREATLGDLPFDLLLSADGINSQTRRLMSEAHPDFDEKEFGVTFLDNWYAYRLPSKGAMRERFLGGERFHASNVFIDNLAKYPKEKFRIVTTGMRQPEEEISVLIKHSADVDLPRLKYLNDSYFGQFVDSKDELDAAWEAGYAGKFEQVHAPTFYLNNVLLVGDAAHGFESTGDLINLGITSVGAFHEIYTRQSDLKTALEEYDTTIGEDLRFYAKFSLRRSKEKISFEVSSIEFAARLGLAKRHPALFGIYERDFELHNYMKAYRQDILKGRLLFFGIPLALVLLIIVL